MPDGAEQICTGRTAVGAVPPRRSRWSFVRPSYAPPFLPTFALIIVLKL